MSSTNKVIRVAAAVITNGDKFFATQRGYGEWRGYWEFPGGKIEVGETPKEALHREIKEELDTEINVGDKLCTVEYDYPSFHLSMDCFLAKVKSGTLTLMEHDAAKWLHRDELDSINWLPADEVVIKGLKNE
ncbi:(deoxy)nucleoside triphosphate pyrophosphohydrolase [Candidatus Saccharibacteria bacterium]|nr:(deoxy)nucleoside triphosphate pyrophosphohydrolase [Candidatus Saccharibacteria bacterium]